MEELGAGEVVGGMVDVCNETREPSRVPFEPERINALLGTDLTKEEMLAYLAKVELTLMKRQTRSWHLPSVRISTAWQMLQRRLQDSSDMTKSRPHFRPEKLQQENFRLNSALKMWQEISQSTADSQRNDLFFRKPEGIRQASYPEDSELRKVITINNPLGEDYSIMRTTTLHGMLTSLATNYNRRKRLSVSMRLERFICQRHFHDRTSG